MTVGTLKQNGTITLTISFKVGPSALLLLRLADIPLT
jgi:hypothetical protein